MSSSEEPDTERLHTVESEIRLIRAKGSRLGRRGGGQSLHWPAFPLSSLVPPPPSLSLSLSQSPTAEALMKTNARNQFSASSFHLVGGLVSAPQLAQQLGESSSKKQPPSPHSSTSRSSSRLQASVATNGRMPPNAAPQHAAVALKARMMRQLCQPQQREIFPFFHLNPNQSGFSRAKDGNLFCLENRRSRRRFFFATYL